MIDNVKRINECLRPDFINGKIFWKKITKNHSEKLGLEAGVPNNKNGKEYWIIQLDNKKYKRSHLMYFFKYSKIPTLIDHIDGNSLNDIPENLRDTTTLINSRNHKRRNIRKIKATGKYQVRLSEMFSKNVDTYEEAVELYDRKRKELWGV